VTGGEGPHGGERSAYTPNGNGRTAPFGKFMSGVFISFTTHNLQSSYDLKL